MIIWTVLSVLLGIVFGLFLKVSIITIITVIAILFYFKVSTNEEPLVGAILGAMFLPIIFGVVVMWVTFFLSSGGIDLSNFFEVILR